MSKVSVIVPVYNAEKFLKRCIDSIINQTYKDLDIILINDGSKDNSLGILRQYETIDDRIRVIDNKNSGVSETRNIGVKNSLGDYIQFIDSDDHIELNMIEESVRYLQNENADLVMSGLFLDMEKNGDIETSIQTFEQAIKDSKKEIGKAVLDRLDGTYINSPVNKLYKKSIIIDNNIIMDKNIDLGEDLLFNLQYLKFCKKVVFLNQSFYHYRMQAESNLTFRYRENNLELMEILYANCKQYLIDCGLKDEVTILNGHFIKWMYSSFLNLSHKDCPMTFSQKYNYVKNSTQKYKSITNNVSDIGTSLKVLKVALSSPLMVIFISKLIYFIKINARKIFYK